MKNHCQHSSIGEPDAGNPPVRFGGRGGATQCAVPTPIGKSRAPLLIGLIGSALVLGIGAFFALKKPDNGRSGRQTAEAPPNDRALASAPTAPPAAWQPLFTEAEWRATGEKGREFKDGLLHLTSHVITKPCAPSGGGKIRTRIKITPGSTAPAIVFREGKTEWRLELILDSQGKPVEFRLVKGTAGSSTPPKTQVSDKREAALRDIKDYAVIELSLAGSVLTASVKGTGTGGAGVRALNEQLGHVSEWGIGATDAWFESVEVQELAAPAAVTVSISPSLPVSASPSSATKDVPFINTLGMKFVPVPITGGPTGVQRVLFSVWETRVQDYEVFAKETKREWDWAKQWLKADPQLPGPTHPAIWVSRQDAIDFCTWLTLRERQAGQLGAGEAYRLPSDLEWSRAAGMSKQPLGVGDYHWGTSWPPPQGSGNYLGSEAAALPSDKDRKPIEGYRDDFAMTSPVGSFAVDRFGLFDLSGNAWEWVQDLYENPGDGLMRGAAWSQFGNAQLKLGYRLHPAVDRLGLDSGFRPVLAPANQVTGK